MIKMNRLSHIFPAIRNVGVSGLLFLLTYYLFEWINLNATFIYNPTPWQNPVAAQAIFHSVLSTLNYIYLFFGMCVAGEVGRVITG